MEAQVTINGKTIQIELTQEQINQIKNQVTPNKRWRAEIGEHFWYVDAEGCVDWNSEEGYDFDDWNYNQRNYFKTKKEAQQHLDKLNLIAEIRTRIEELNGNWKPDWEDLEQEKYYFYFEMDGGFFDFLNAGSNKVLDDWKYLKSRDVVMELINEFGDKLEVLFER